MKNRLIRILIAVCCLSFSFAMNSFAQNPCQIQIYDTEGEGLELRNKPAVESSSFGAVPEGATLYVQAVVGDWVYTSYHGNNGWCNLAHPG